MPEQPDEEDAQRFHIPLDELTGKHGYALVRDEDDDSPIDPGAPVAYVAEPMKEQPNTMTVEGAIAGIGNLAAAAARDDDPSSAWVLRVVLAMFVIPIFLVVIGRATGLFGWW